MAPYSLDLRERVARAWDASGDADDVAATFGVSRAWVHRLIQRRRETGSLAPQMKFPPGRDCSPARAKRRTRSPALVNSWRRACRQRAQIV